MFGMFAAFLFDQWGIFFTVAFEATISGGECLRELGVA
jgi:hypothetical protein